MAITLRGIYPSGKVTLNVPSGAPTDPFFSSVSLLLHGEGANNSTTITDSSSNNFTMTPTGGNNITTAQFKYGAASMSFDPVGKTIVSPVDAKFGFGTGDFTMECWYRPAIVNKFQVIMDTRPSGQSGATKPWIAMNNNGRLGFWVGNTARIEQASATMSIGTWYFIAVSRVSGVSRLFLNGTQVSSNYTDTNNYGTSNDLFMGTVGDSRSNTTWWLNGQLDEVRVTKGVGRYTTNFTSPDAAFPNQ